jgi:hypothetical protein
MEVLKKADYALLCRVLAPRVDSRDGICGEYGYLWEPDKIGLARLRQQMRKLLIESGDFRTEDLEDWTLEEILPILSAARWQADGVLRAEQRAQLQEPFELGLRHAARWQQFVREAVAIIMQHHKDRLRGKKGLRAPLPGMVQQHLAGFRQRDMGDIPWMFFVLGAKLEGVFDAKGAFVPEDAYRDIRVLSDYIRPNVDYYVDGRMSAGELSDLWSIIRPMLLAEEEVPTEVSDNADEASESGNAPPKDEGEEVLHSNDYRWVKYNGHCFTFTDYQAAAVKLLWEQKGGELGQAYILEEIGSATNRFRNVFKKKGGMHPAWGTMIIRGQTKGTYCLAPRQKT